MAEEIILTEAEIVEKLVNDPYFSIDFAINNQPVQIGSKVEEIIGRTLNGKDDLRAILVEWYNTKNNNFVQALQVPYDGAVSNYTGGLDNLFGSSDNEVTVNDGVLQRSTSVWGSILAGIGAFATSFGSQLNADGSALTPEQQQAQQQALLQAQQQEAEQRRKTITIIVVAVLVLALIIGLVILRSRRKRR